MSFNVPILYDTVYPILLVGLFKDTTDYRQLSNNILSFPIPHFFHYLKPIDKNIRITNKSGEIHK